MLVRNLQPGESFVIDLGRYGRPEYRLIYTNDCRAYVELLKKQQRAANPLDDERGGRINISPNTECVQYDADLEDFMGIAATSKTAAAKKETNSSKASYKQERPVKEGTIRANLLAAVMGGETNLDKLAKKFTMARTNVASHIRDMWRFHGYGFTITGDTVKITPPVGGALKVKAAAPAKPAVAKAAPKKSTKKDLLDDDDDDFFS